MKKGLLIVLGIIVIIAVIIFISYNATMIKYKKEMNNIEISNIDLSKINDGTYIGSHKIFPITVEVKIIVKDHRIESIELLKHINGQGKPAEVIIDRVIENQSLNVDTITGATGSSKVILKAIEKALNK